jgi:hypothetical protein
VETSKRKKSKTSSVELAFGEKLSFESTDAGKWHVLLQGKAREKQA